MLKVSMFLSLGLVQLWAGNPFLELSKKESFVFDTALSYSTLSRSIAKENNKVDSEVKSVLYATVSLSFLPKSLDLTLSHSQSVMQNLDSNLYNPLNKNNEAKHSSLSLIPYYNKTYGGIGLFYTKSEQNSQYKNKTNSTMRLSEYFFEGDKIRFRQLANTDKLKANQSYQAKEKFSYLGVKYLLPEYKYLPKGANVFYSKMERETLYFGTVGKSNHLIHLSNDGEMYGMGLQRSLDELPLNEFSLHLLQLSKGKFDGFPAIELSEYTAGVTYKAKNWYLKVDGLIYVAEEFSHKFTKVSLDIPKHTDIMATVHLGTSF